MGAGWARGRRGGGGVHHHRPNPPPPNRAQTPPHPPPRNESFLSSRPTKAMTGRFPGPKGPPPPTTTTTARPTKAVPAPKPTNPPKTATTTPPPPPHTHQNRHPQGCREEGRPSQGSDRRDGRPRTLPQRGREGHRPWYPRAEVRCRLGGIPRRHHPLRGEPLPPLPHPRGGRAAPGRGPGGGSKEDQTPHPHKRNT